MNRCEPHTPFPLPLHINISSVRKPWGIGVNSREKGLIFCCAMESTGSLNSPYSFSSQETIHYLRPMGKWECFPAHTEREKSKERLGRRHFKKVDTLRCSCFCPAFILGAHLGKGVANVSRGSAFRVNAQSLISHSPLSGTVSKYFSSNKKIHIWSLRS